MNDTLPIKKKLSSPSHLSESDVLFCVSLRQFYNPRRRMQFCFNIVAVHPSSITCYDIFQKVFLSIRMIKQLLTVKRFSFRASVSRRGTNFAATRRIFSLSVKIRWQELLHIPTSSATSRTVRRRFRRITASTFSA